MGLTVRKTIKLAKGVNLNLGKTGASISVGAKGLRYNVSTRDLGIPAFNKLLTGKTSKKSKAAKRKEELKKKKAEAAKLNTQNNELLVEEFENEIELLKSIHEEADEALDWEAIAKAEAPFNKGSMGPKEIEAKKALDDFDPGFFGKLFGGKDEEKEGLEKALEEAKKADKESYDLWAGMHELSERVLKQDLDAYLEAVALLNPLEDLIEYGSDFEFGAINMSVMEVEFCVKSQDIIPKESLSILKSGKLSKKAMSKTAYYDITKDYVCSSAIRIARDVMALLPVQVVIVHAVDGEVDPSTGHIKDKTILSVRFIKKTLDSLNLDMIDPSEAMVNFECNMDFMKTKGFKEVARVND